MIESSRGVGHAAISYRLMRPSMAAQQARSAMRSWGRLAASASPVCRMRSWVRVRHGVGHAESMACRTDKPYR